MTYLDTINAILGTCGYVPLASLEEEHPFKDAAVSLFDTTLSTELSRGWYFNRKYDTLHPNAQGEIYVSHDVLDFSPLTPGFYKAGNRICKIGDFLTPVSSSIYGRLVYAIPFEDCPALFQNFVTALTKHSFQTVYDGDSTKTRQLAALLEVAWASFHTSEIRGTGANILDSNVRLQGVRNAFRNTYSRIGTRK